MTRPVCIVTGFLGAGKTTLALGLIRSGELKDAVLIVNDFGDASFDSVEVGATGTAYRAMDGGCICCTVKDDLLRTLHEIPSLFPYKTSLWIETSGISNPSDLIPLFEGSSFLSESYSLQSVVAVVDGRNSFDWLLAQESAAEQLSMASISIINRHDKVQGLDYLKQQLHSLNPLSDVHILSLKDEPPIPSDVFLVQLMTTHTARARFRSSISIDTIVTATQPTQSDGRGRLTSLSSFICLANGLSKLDLGFSV